MAATNLSPTAERVRDILLQYSRLADAILSAQSKAIGKTPADLGPADLERLTPRIVAALSMFTNPEKGKQAGERLLALR